MNIYCAGKTQDYPKVRVIQRLVKATGHKVTFDWTAIVEANGGDANGVVLTDEKKAEYAVMDAGGVYHADLVIALGNPNLCGTLWECGMAIAWNKPLWLVEWYRNARASIFDWHPLVTKMEMQDLGEALWKISAKRLETAVPRIKVLPDGRYEMIPAVDV